MKLKDIIIDIILWAIAFVVIFKICMYFVGV